MTIMTRGYSVHDSSITTCKLVLLLVVVSAIVVVAVIMEVLVILFSEIYKAFTYFDIKLYN